MNDRNILYDYVWDEEILDVYRQMCYHWEGKLLTKEQNRGNREVWEIENYPDPDNMVTAYLKHISALQRRQFLKVLDKGYSVDTKLSRYKPGQDYQWHSDQNTTTIDKKNPNWRRVISSVTYLNDGYEGGGTEFESGMITPVSGKTVVFPSCFLYPHRGTSVITGVKYLLVMHVWT